MVPTLVRVEVGHIYIGARGVEGRQRLWLPVSFSVAYSELIIFPIELNSKFILFGG